jgi:hypothetical protein
MAAPPLTEATISTRILTRLIVLLIALWSLLAGLVLVGFHGASSGAMGAGVTDEAGQRLVGAHLLVLVPAYLLLAWRPDRYQAFLWLPLVAQAAVAVAVGYSMISGESAFGDGILVFTISAMFAGLLGFVMMTEQRTAARVKFDASQSAASDGADTALPGQR